MTDTKAPWFCRWLWHRYSWWDWSGPWDMKRMCRFCGKTQQSWHPPGSNALHLAWKDIE